MSTDNERGALGGRFHDLPTPADTPELSWGKMAPYILQPTEPEREPEDRAFAWWWFVVGALVLLIGAGWYTLTRQQVDPESPIVEKVAVSDPSTVASASADSASAGVSRRVGTDVAGERMFSAPVTRRADPLVPRGSADERSYGYLDSPAPESPTRQQSVIDPQADQPALATTPGLVAQLPERLITKLTFVPPYLSTEVVPGKPFSKAGKTKAISLLAGPLLYNLGYDDPTATATTQLSARIRLGYEQAINDRWFISTGLELHHYRFQSAFVDVDENARIYQPGTIDTIFRNRVTGDETVSTTDTVGGTRIRRFVNDNVVNTVGLPIMLGYSRTFSNHRLSLAAGPRVDFLLNRAGKVVVNDLEVVDFTDASGFGKNIRWGGRLEAGYDWQPRGRWSLSLRVGAQAALSDWSTAGFGQRPALFDGMIGLRYRW